MSVSECKLVLVTAQEVSVLLYDLFKMAAL